VSSPNPRSAFRVPHFVALEGPEGSGKTTQIHVLARALTARGLTVQATREPGGTPIGEQLRAILLGTATHAMLPQTETLILLAARAQHVAEIIEPALARGAIVLCDRYAGATFAYQGYGRGLPLEVLRSLQTFAAGACAPELTLLFDLPVEVGLARRQATGDLNRLDAAGLDFHRRVRAGYRELAAADPAHWVLLDATQPAAEVTAQALRILASRLRLPAVNSDPAGSDQRCVGQGVERGVR
jgi:dTMP kinase